MFDRLGDPRIAPVGTVGSARGTRRGACAGPMGGLRGRCLTLRVSAVMSPCQSTKRHRAGNGGSPVPCFRSYQWVSFISVLFCFWEPWVAVLVVGQLLCAWHDLYSAGHVLMDAIGGLVDDDVVYYFSGVCISSLVPQPLTIASVIVRSRVAASDTLAVVVCLPSFYVVSCDYWPALLRLAVFLFVGCLTTTSTQCRRTNNCRVHSVITTALFPF